VSKPSGVRISSLPPSKKDIMQSSHSTIAEIKDRLNIADVLSSYIPLKKAGANFKAPCPFHHEQTPSLMVSTSKQIWHCFGCGEGGDIFTFVMKYENVDFGEALKMLADRAGVELPKFNKEDTKEDQYRRRMVEVNDLAAKYYNKVLLQSSQAEAARTYLKVRGLSKETIEEWGIGFAPEGYHYLEEFLLKRGFTKSELLDAGVSSKGQRGDLYDRFFNRITFPIKNYSGEVVGFTARTLSDDKKAAKYLNSPETVVYSKSKVIFGLYSSKQAIRKEDCTIVVEGNMDVISAHQAGFKNVVASSGTAFTFEQLKLLSRLSKNLKFAFDTDQAGATATRRALDMALQLGFTVYIVKIEGAKDPDELIKQDRNKFAKALETAPLYLDYFFEKSFSDFDPSSIEHKKRVAAELVPLLQSITDPLELSHYSKQLAQRLGVSESTIYEYLAKGKVQKTTEKVAPAKADRLVQSKSYLLERSILGYALFKPTYKQKVLEAVDESDFKDPDLRELFKSISAYNGDPGTFLDSVSPDMAELAKLAQFVVESEYNELVDSPGFENNFTNVLMEFKEGSTKAAMRTVISEMVAAEKSKDKEKLAELNNKFLKLAQTLNKNQ
jgi:DNA primase